MPKGALTIARTPKPGEPGSGHVYIVAHRDGRYQAACFCGWPWFDGGDWHGTYEQVFTDWRGHAEEVGRGQ